MKRALALAIVVAVGCSDPEVSQIIVRIEADPGVAAMTRSLEVQIDGGATRGAFSNAETLTLDGNSFPRQIALAPKDDDPTRFYRVVARARRQGVDNPLAQTFAQAALIGTYVRGETRVIVLRLEDSCIDVVCGTNDHCTGSDCVPPPDRTPTLDGGLADMSMPDMGQPTRCSRDEECDDGVACTIDACTTGACTNEPDHSACPPSENECERAVCVVGTGCTNEARSGPCDNSLFCDGVDTCSGGVCNGAGDPCVGMTECNEELDTCTGCSEPDDCINGRVCSGGTCTCPTGMNEQCDVAGDEDCDGLVNCEDFDCNGASCGPDGRICTEGVCGCAGTAELCANGVDDDCNGDADCDDAACDGRTCASGRICISGSCQDEPVFDGGVDDPDGGIVEPDLGVDGGPGPIDFGTDFGTVPDSGGPVFEDMSLSMGLDGSPGT